MAGTTSPLSFARPHPPSPQALFRPQNLFHIRLHLSAVHDTMTLPNSPALAESKMGNAGLGFESRTMSRVSNTPPSSQFKTSTVPLRSSLRIAYHTSSTTLFLSALLKESSQQMATRTRRAALRDRAPVSNTPAQSSPMAKGRVKGKAKGPSAKVSKKRNLTPSPPDVEIEDAPAVEDGSTQTHGEAEKSQEEFSIGGFSFEDSQQSGLGLPGLGLGESVILQSTPPSRWRKRQQATKRAPQSHSASIMKGPAGLKASSPLPPSSPIPTSPFPSSRPVDQEREPELELVEEAPSEHLSDDPFGFLSAERKLRAKKGQPKRRDKGKAVDRSTPPPETTAEPPYDDQGIEDLYASEGEVPLPQTHRTPPPRQASPSSERSSSLTSLQSPHTPSTPNKRNSNKRKPARSRDSSPEPSAAPTSPSPSKPRVRSKPSADATETGATTREIGRAHV